MIPEDFRQLLDERHNALMAEFEAVNERLDTLNGRVRDNEREITKIKAVGSVIQAGFGLLLGFFGMKG